MASLGADSEEKNIVWTKNQLVRYVDPTYQCWVHGRVQHQIEDDNVVYVMSLIDRSIHAFSADSPALCDIEEPHKSPEPCFFAGQKSIGNVLIEAVYDKVSKLAIGYFSNDPKSSGEYAEPIPTMREELPPALKLSVGKKIQVFIRYAKTSRSYGGWQTAWISGIAVGKIYFITESPSHKGKITECELRDWEKYLWSMEDTEEGTGLTLFQSVWHGDKPYTILDLNETHAKLNGITNPVPLDEIKPVRLDSDLVVEFFKGMREPDRNIPFKK